MFMTYVRIALDSIRNFFTPHLTVEFTTCDPNPEFDWDAHRKYQREACLRMGMREE